MSKQTALDFVDAINRHDVEAILALMTDDHLFVDAYDHRQDKTAMTAGWPGYFAWFPDYLIEVETVLEQGDTVVLLGYAGGSWQGIGEEQNHWRLPAAWRVEANRGRVRLWQVYCDSKIPYEIINRNG